MDQAVFADAVAALDRFYGVDGLTVRIADVEHSLSGQERETIREVLQRAQVTTSALAAALEIKRVAGQVNVAIHALAIALVLPVILEDREVVQGASLGAGSTGRGFDLETDRRVAEFKLTNWRGGAEPVRQNELFADVFHLADAATSKRRELYVTELDRPLRFLGGRRSLKSVLAKSSVTDRFRARHGDRYTVVADYWADVGDRVTLIDVTQLLPAITALPPEIDPGGA
jgi:hypothetical protein